MRSKKLAKLQKLFAGFQNARIRWTKKVRNSLYNNIGSVIYISSGDLCVGVLQVNADLCVCVCVLQINVVCSKSNEPSG